MLRISALRNLFYSGAAGVLLLGPSTHAEPPTQGAPPAGAGALQLAQAQPPTPPSQPPPTAPPPSQPPPSQPPPAGTQAPQAPSAPETAGFAPAAAAGGGTTSTAAAQQTAAAAGPAASGVGGAEAQTRSTSDVGELLSRSPSTTGVELQHRTPIISDPRVRGYHVGQLITNADGGFFFPARQDLDTSVSKFDANNLRDVIVNKGPYSVRYQPGFAFIDITTLDTPREENGFHAHERSTLGYQTNGQRWQGSQSIWGGNQDWGFRTGYTVLSGSDYRDGHGNKVPSEYNSQNFVYDLGISLSPDSRLEFKGLSHLLRDVEFPGLYFDITNLYTNAYSLRYTLDHQEYFDHLAVDLWDNRTSANGNTQRTAKQVFLNQLFGPQLGLNVSDLSNTTFSDHSQGYRVFVTWGEKDHVQLTVGNDFTYLSQKLIENIRLHDATNLTVLGGGDAIQNLQIPPAFSMDPGIFADLVVPVTDRWNIKSGIRGNLVQTDSHNRFVSSNIASTQFAPVPLDFDPILFSSNPNDPNLQRTFDLWSAYVSTDYKIGAHLTAQGGFGYAQRPPTPTELYSGGVFLGILQPGLNRMVGNPHLDPEKAKQFDLGLRADYGWFRGGANGFYSWVDDYITYDLNSTVQQAQHGAGVYTFTNTNLATLAGGELFAETNITEWLTPFANLSYVQGRDLTHIDTRRPADLVSSRRTIDQEPLPSIPPLEVRTGFRIHEAKRNPKWNIEFNVRMVDGQDFVASSLGELPTPGFTIFNMSAYWQVTEALLVKAGIENIGDRFYREHLDVRAGNILFEPGFNMYFGAQLQY